MELKFLESEFNWARNLTLDLLQACSQEDLQFQLAPAFGPLWKQFRHIARVHENYLNALEAREINFGFAGCTYSGGGSKEALIEYFEKLKARHNSLMNNIDPSISIDWHGEHASLGLHLTRLLSHETLHHGQLIHYWRALGRTFPKSWSGWGEKYLDS